MSNKTNKPAGGLDSNTAGELEALGSNDTTSPGDGVRAPQDQPRPAGGACGEAGFDSPTGTPPNCPECGLQLANFAGPDGAGWTCLSPGCLPVDWHSQEDDGSMVGVVKITDCPQCGSSDLRGRDYTWCNTCGWHDSDAAHAAYEFDRANTVGAI